jgi:hypothetical protein
MRIGALIALLALSAAAGGEPRPLSGTPAGETGLRLLVADEPPFVLDVDAGTAMRVPGIPKLDRGVSWVVGVGGRAGVVVADSFDDARLSDARLYAVLGGAPRATPLGSGRDVVPAADGSSIWVKRRTGRARCTLRHVGLDGRTLGAARTFPCASTIYDGGDVGLVVSRTRVIDPATGRTLLRTRWGIVAVAGRTLVLKGPDTQLTLLDADTRAERRLPWPSILTGIDEPAADPSGRYVALAFANPAWEGGPQQAFDAWLLDTKTGGVTQLPSMPAFVELKRTSMEWTADGRLVLLGEYRARAFVAIWRPGEKELAVKTVRLPQRAGGSDSFAPLR